MATKENKTDENKKADKKLKISTVFYALIIAIAAYFVLIGILIYGFGTSNKLTKFTAKYVPYPAAVVNQKNFITIDALRSNLQSIKSFYENQDFSSIGMRVDFSTEDGKKRLQIRERGLLNKMIEDEAIEILARRNGIIITAEAADQNVERKLEEYGNKEEVENRLSRLYGWTLSDFKEKIVKPAMYREELEKMVLSQKKEEFSREAREKIEKAADLLSEKKDFAEVANSYSQGLTAGEGGELGWFRKNQLIPELADLIFSLQKGKRSDIIESSLGYHIVEVENRKVENGEELVKIRQIFARKKTFADWLGEEMGKMRILIPLKDYYWDSQRLLVEFKDAGMREFEKDVRENFQGDASIIF
ncbi:MAG: peptidylprolyl isomerase [Candidatus Moranbacteria bacterium]|nr:peptidylprolyl isomerase [Candidatus Moranbacteria bacterium]